VTTEANNEVLEIVMFNSLELGIGIENTLKSMGINEQAARVKAELKLDISCVLMDSTEKAASSSISEKKAIYRLIVSNLERGEHWYGPEPAPHMKFLDMCWLDVEGQDILSKNPEVVKKGYTIPVQSVHRNLRIQKTMVECLEADIGFHLRVDRNFYGPFKSVEVGPLELIKGKHFYLPIMCLSPFSELT
jgi:hypothetical protein